MGFSTEVLFFCGLGYIVLGPKRMQEILQHIARAKAQFDKMRSEIKSQLTSELEGRADDAEAARPEQPAPATAAKEPSLQGLRIESKR